MCKESQCVQCRPFVPCLGLPASSAPEEIKRADSKADAAAEEVKDIFHDVFTEVRLAEAQKAGAMH